MSDAARSGREPRSSQNSSRSLANESFHTAVGYENTPVSTPTLELTKEDPSKRLKHTQIDEEIEESHSLLSGADKQMKSSILENSSKKNQSKHQP